MTNIQLWRVHLFFAICKPCCPWKPIFWDPHVVSMQGGVVGLRFGGQVLPDGRVDCGLRSVRASQGLATAWRIAGMQSNNQEELKLNMHIRYIRYSFYRNCQFHYFSVDQLAKKCCPKHQKSAVGRITDLT